MADEIEDSNVGFLFTEHLPFENTQILITSMRNPSEVVPGILKIEPELVEFKSSSIIALTLKIDYINGSGFTDIIYYTAGSRKSTWKFLMEQDDSYMTDYEKMFRETIIHKNYVQKSAEKLSKYLMGEGAKQHAKLLLDRATIHDNSKISCIDELRALSRIVNDKSTLRDASRQLSPIKREAIMLHWENNSHHPEHFESVIDMSKLDIMEMCCDWHARSKQYNTNFLEYVQKSQSERFHFPDWMFTEIWHYCKVLDSEI